MSAFGCLYWVDVADDVRYRHVRRGKLLYISVRWASIFDRRPLTRLLNEVAASPTDGVERIVIDLTTCNHRNGVVEERTQSAKNPAFGLAPKPEQNHIVSRENCIDDLRDDSFFITDNSRKNGLFLLKFAYEVDPHFVFDRTCAVKLV